MMKRPLFAALALGTLAVGAADAATMRYAFTATTFPIGTTPPVDPVIGAFTLDFSFGRDVTGETAGIALESINLTVGSRLGYTYDLSEDRLWVGGLETGAQNNISGSDDFRLVIAGLGAGAPVAERLVYSQSSFLGGLTASSVALDISEVAAVPLPASIAFLGTALAGLGALRRRTRRAG